MDPTKNILVTGGAGYVGVHTCFELLKHGYNIFVIDSLLNSTDDSISNILKYKDSLKSFGLKNIFKFYKGDITDINFIKKVFEESFVISKPIGGVIHFAGKKSVNESISLPLDYWEINLLGTINLIKVMIKYNCFNFIFSSSASVYGTIAKSPIVESSQFKPINPYGNTKAAVEIFLNDVFKSNPKKWKIAILRYFNPLGAHPSGLIGESPLIEPTNIFPKICEVASSPAKEFNIYGNDWLTKDGTCIRDYIHILDLVDGHIFSYKHLLSNPPDILTLNLGTGKGTSVLELLTVFNKVNKCDVRFKFVERRKGDVGICFADNSKAKEILNWKTERSLEDMCLDGWNWYKKNYIY